MPNNEEPRITPEQVVEVLQTCYDPCCKERAVSIVELGLIQGVQVAENGHDVRVELLLTSGWCPFSTHLLQEMNFFNYMLITTYNDKGIQDYLTYLT